MTSKKEDKPQRKPRKRRATPAEREDERKQRVLHTRISEQLAGDIYRVAEDLRVPVSNLVRNVLEDVFSVVESVTGNVGDLIEDIIDRAERTREKLERQGERREPEERQSASATDRPAVRDFPDVLGWQPLILNQPQTCADCGAAIARGDHAALGLTAGGASQVYLCQPCVDARQTAA